MASAARVHIAERGRDPRRYVLLATGGAGPVHAWYLAARLGIERVVCPPSAGAASALGLLLAPARSGSGARTSGSSSSCPRDRTRGLPREPSRMRSGRPTSGLSPGCRRESGPRGSTSGSRRGRGAKVGEPRRPALTSGPPAWSAMPARGPGSRTSPSTAADADAGLRSLHASPRRPLSGSGNRRSARVDRPPATPGRTPRSGTGYGDAGFADVGCELTRR